MTPPASSRAVTVVMIASSVSIPAPARALAPVEDQHQLPGEQLGITRTTQLGLPTEHLFHTPFASPATTDAGCPECCVRRARRGTGSRGTPAAPRPPPSARRCPGCARAVSRHPRIRRELLLVQRNPPFQARREDVVLALEELVHRPLRDTGRPAQRLDADGYALAVDEVGRRVQQPVPRGRLVCSGHRQVTAQGPDKETDRSPQVAWAQSRVTQATEQALG